MDIRIDLPDLEIETGAEPRVAEIEAAVAEAVEYGAQRYAREIEAEGSAGAREVTATEEAQDGGATIFAIAATAFVAGLAKQLGAEAAKAIAEYAREWLADRKAHLVKEAASE
jgi:hypothetical protein